MFNKPVVRQSCFTTRRIAGIFSILSDASFLAAISTTQTPQCEYVTRLPSQFPRELKEFAIEKPVARRLLRPHAEKAFAGQYRKAYENGLRQLLARGGNTYATESAIPEGYRAVAADEFVRKGIKLLLPASASEFEP